MSNLEQKQLQYFLASKNGIAVISFAGVLERGSAPILDACLKELRNNNSKFVILNLSDLADRVELSVIPDFARFQKSIREMPSELKLCGIRPELGRTLDAKGILRKTEVAGNLQEALQGIRGTFS